MYSNLKANWDDLSNPGDYIKTEDGIVIVCKCGDTIALSTKWNITYDPLDVSPSISHLNKDGSSKCHYFIKQGELVNA